MNRLLTPSAGPFHLRVRFPAFCLLDGPWSLSVSGAVASSAADKSALSHLKGVPLSARDSHRCQEPAQLSDLLRLMRIDPTPSQRERPLYKKSSVLTGAMPSKAYTPDFVPTQNIGVIVPTYKAKKTILSVISGLPDWVDHIIIVDDACPENTGAYVEAQNTDPRLTVIILDENLGVGGATLTGFEKALGIGCTVMVKMDSDDQHDPKFLRPLVTSLTNSGAGYSKGSRFLHPGDIGNMPRSRIFLNSILSITNKFASGYYSITDPTNGFVAIRADIFAKLDREKIVKRYFFESDMLYHLTLFRVPAVDVATHVRYNDEESGLKFRDEALNFMFGNIRNFFRRIWLRHFLLNFSLPAIYLIFSTLFMITALIWGGTQWYKSISTGIQATPGTVMIPALLIIISINMITSFFVLDVNDEPKPTPDFQKHE